MKGKSKDFDREKKIRKVEKGMNKVGKHRKTLYNLNTELDDDFDDLDFESDFYDEDNDKQH